MSSLPPILPVGTAVVTRAEHKPSGSQSVRPAGSVGLIVRCPVDLDHAYRVRFPGGDEASLLREQLDVLSHFQAGDPGSRMTSAGDDPARVDWDQHVIYRCVIGSRAYGLDHDASDTDRRGIYLPSADQHWSLWKVPEQLENDATQECYWELEKFLNLALRANPNVLEVLYTPLVEHASELARELLSIRNIFLSKLVYQTFNGYVLSQFKKIEGDLRNQGAVKPKHAMHLIRLLLSGITALREGHLPVRVEAQHRDRLLAIRHGQMNWEQVNAWRLELHSAFESAFAATKLPERPDYQAANAFLLQARRSMLETYSRAKSPLIHSFDSRSPSEESSMTSSLSVDARLKQVARQQPYPLLFVTISGAHLYGFPSPDSDYDLRGVHVLPKEQVLGLSATEETREISSDEDGLELDLVTHDAAKFLKLMLRKNGYVLEQLYSPLIIHTTPEHEELKQIGRGCVTKHHAHHYLGFTQTQWKLFAKENPPRIKPLLYVYRVLLTGIHLMRTGEVQANLLTLNDEFRLPYINELVARKTGGKEKSTLDAADLAFHERERQRLEAMLQEASEKSHLPETPSSKPALNDLLVRVRLRS